MSFDEIPANPAALWDQTREAPPPGLAPHSSLIQGPLPGWNVLHDGLRSTSCQWRTGRPGRIYKQLNGPTAILILLLPSFTLYSPVLPHFPASKFSQTCKSATSSHVCAHQGEMEDMQLSCRRITNHTLVMPLEHDQVCTAGGTVLQVCDQ